MANEFVIKKGFESKGDSAVTGSLIVSSSGTANDLRVGITNLIVSASGNTSIGTSPVSSYKLFVYGGNLTSILGYSTATGIIGEGVTGPGIQGQVYQDGPGTFIGVKGISSPADSPFINTIYIGGLFSAPGGGYSVQLQDGTEAAGKVLVSQTANGLANWSTRLSGSYDLTGSLAISGSVKSQSGNHATSDALLQATLLYLSNNF